MLEHGEQCIVEAGFSLQQETGMLMMLTYRDPKARPSAKDALQDPWLKGNSTERNQGKPIDATVVQRIQVSTCCPYPFCKTWFPFSMTKQIHGSFFS